MVNLQAVLPKLVTFILFFVVLFIYTKLAGPIPFYINNVTTNKTDFFTSSGEGKVVVKPDVALASVGVSAVLRTYLITHRVCN